MALSYTQTQTISANQNLLQQMAGAILKQAITRITNGAATTPEIALSAAIIKNPSAYAPRFLMDALILNQAGLSSADGGKLDSPPTDAAIDTAVTSQWAAQVVAGL